MQSSPRVGGLLSRKLLLKVFNSVASLLVEVEISGLLFLLLFSRSFELSLRYFEKLTKTEHFKLISDHTEATSKV